MSKNFVRLLNNYVKPFWPWLILSAFLTLLSSASTLPLPWIIQYLIDDVIVNEQTEDLIYILVAVLGVTIGSRGIMMAQQYVVTFVGQRVKFHIRHALVAHLHRLSLSYFEQTQTGKLMSRIISDGAAIQKMLSSGMVNIFTDFMTLVVIITVLFFIHFKLALITVLILPCYAVTHMAFAGRMRRTSKEVRKKTDEVMANLEESISGVRVVKSFVNERYESDEFKKKVTQHFTLNMTQNLQGTLWNAIAALVSGVGGALVLWYGGSLIEADELTIGELLMFYAYTAYVFDPIVNLISINVTIQRANAAIDRLFETLDTAPLIHDASGAVAIPSGGGRVQFKNVTFGYSSIAPILHDISMDVEPGMKVGIVGPSGSGKSTLVKLIPRLYETNQGEVCIDGIDVRQIELLSIRTRIGMVPQESTLFSATLADNIRYGRLDATQEEVVEVAKAANIHSFIETLGEGYETRLGEQGIKLSGGQKQRMAIARALLTKPQIIILDDCTSALDSKTEARIQATLHDVLRDRTGFIVAHRLSSVSSCDRIYVLDEGKIVEQGSHDELIQVGRLYSRMHEQQYRGDMASIEEEG
jgi:subfamily B ATP-binding cassette protein MsbA